MRVTIPYELSYGRARPSVTLLTLARRVYGHPFWNTREVIEKLPRESFDDVTTRPSP